MKKKYFWELIFLASLLSGALLYSPALVSASTIVSSSTISTDTYWTKADSPYLVNTSIYVAPGATLDLAPGTVVKFARGTGITVGGSLNAIGSDKDRIYLTSINDESISGRTGGGVQPSPGDWAGLSFIHNDSIQSVRHVSLRYASMPIFANTLVADLQDDIVASSTSGLSFYQSNFNINNLDLENISGQAIAAYSSSTLAISSSTISEVGSGISTYNGSSLTFSGGVMDKISGSALTLFNQSRATIANSTLQNIQAGSYGDALIVYGDSDFSLDNSFIKNVTAQAVIIAYNNQHASFNVSSSTLSGGNGDGIMVYGDTPVVISNSLIENFQNNGIEEFSNGRVNLNNSRVQNNDIGLNFSDANLTISTSSIQSNKRFGILYNGASTLMAQNIWWGDPQGPFNQSSNASGTGNAVSDNIIFNPWLTSDPFIGNATSSSATTTGSNVIFLPGLEGSRLYTKGLISENQLWEPNRNADVDKLNMNSDGESKDVGIYTRDIINKSNILPFGLAAEDFYQKFSDFMDSEVKNNALNAWEAIPYDWRRDYNDLIVNGIKLADNHYISLPDEVARMASSSRTHRVTIVTHSNGALLAKSLIDYLQKKGKAGLVDKLIMVAAPELGNPGTLGALLHGDEQAIRKFGLTFMSPSTARNFSENMPSAYDLLPSKKYLNQTSTAPISFDSSVDKVNNFRATYGNDIKNYNSLSDFLLAKDGRSKPEIFDTANPNVLNARLLDQAATVQAKLTSWIPPVGLQVTEIAGSGLPTTNGIEYLGKEECFLDIAPCKYELDHELIKTLAGDGTVVDKSAITGLGEGYYLNIYQYNKDNNKNMGHANILEIPSIEKLVGNIIEENSSSLPAYVSRAESTNNDQSSEIGVHSPVSIDAYDELGNHTGPISNFSSSSDISLVEQNIPNSSYEETGEGKYINLADGNYKIELAGLDVGSFTLTQKLKQGDTPIAENIFADIPTTPAMTAELIVKTSTSSMPVSILAIDEDNDGIVDATMTPATNIDPSYYLLLMKKTILTLNLDNKTQTNILSKIDNLLKLIAKGKVKNAVKKIQAFNHNLELKLTKNRGRKAKIPKDDIVIMVDLLNKLLDSLTS